MASEIKTKHYFKKYVFLGEERNCLHVECLFTCGDGVERYHLGRFFSVDDSAHTYIVDEKIRSAAISAMAVMARWNRENGYDV